MTKIRHQRSLVVSLPRQTFKGPVVSHSDVTPTIERLEAFEKRAGVRVDAMSGFLTEPDDDGEQRLNVRGELHLTDGATLDQSLLLELSVFDEQGRVIETTSDVIDEETFYSFHTFDFSVYLPAHVFVRARIVPRSI